MFQFNNASLCHNCPLSYFRPNTDYSTHADNGLISNLFPMHNSTVANGDHFSYTVRIFWWSVNDCTFFNRSSVPYFNPAAGSL